MIFTQYLKKPRQIGALMPSSKKLATQMCIGLENALNIAEIGSGTGALTKIILKNKPSNAKFLAVEINAKIAQIFKQKFENITLEIDNAQNLPQILQNHNIKELDCVISSIPWMSLKNHAQDELLQSIFKSLKFGGIFTTYVYFLPNFNKRKRFKIKLQTLFAEVKISKIIWLNFPPAFVYYCKK